MSRIPEREDLQRALAARHGRAVQEKFNQATVAICGLGGLGSNIAIALARAGVGRLILTDFDRVDITNLHRQQYKATQLGEFKTEALAANLREIAPYLTIETHTPCHYRGTWQIIIRWCYDGCHDEGGKGRDHPSRRAPTP